MIPTFLTRAEKEQDTKIYQARLYEMVISFVVKENTLQVIKVEHA